MRAAAVHAIQTIHHRIRFAITACDKMLSYWHSTINTITTTSATTTITVTLVSMHGGKVNLISY